MKVTDIHIDAVGGLAGDMFVAALLDFNPQLWPLCKAELKSLKLPSHIKVSLVDYNDAVFCGKKFSVEGLEGEKSASGHNHICWKDLKRNLEGSGLKKTVRSIAIDIFTLLAEAEGFVHGIKLTEVTFHEVGAYDSIIDIVLASVLIESLGPCNWSIGLIPKGSGLVSSQHGIIPVPAPATVKLLNGFLLVDDGEVGERVTPTGAAIIRYLNLKQSLNSIPLKLIGSGIGFGARKFKSRSNITRVIAFERLQKNIQGDEVEVIRCEIDDQTGEDLAVAIGRLWKKKGVLDICQWPVFGKKGRIAIAVQVIAKINEADKIASALFDETTTLGVRRTLQSRQLVSRQIVNIEGGTIKIAHRPSGVSAKADIDNFLSVDSQIKRSHERRLKEDKALGAKDKNAKK